MTVNRLAALCSILFGLLQYPLFSQDLDLQMSHFSVGDELPTEGKVFFDFNSPKVYDSCLVYLDVLAVFLIENEGLVIDVGVHTDSRGPAEYSRRLDHARAQWIRDFLIERGVDPEQLEANGYGSSKPIIAKEAIENMKTQEERERAHATNRRVEFCVVATS